MWTEFLNSVLMDSFCLTMILIGLWARTSVFFKVLALRGSIPYGIFFIDPNSFPRYGTALCLKTRSLLAPPERVPYGGAGDWHPLINLFITFLSCLMTFLKTEEFNLITIY